jgi:AraC-like DNA-binding protein
MRRGLRRSTTCSACASRTRNGGLERIDASADEISWQVGYEDPAFFRRLFKRVTGLTPGAYRKRFQMPAFARSRGSQRSAMGRGAGS